MEDNTLSNKGSGNNDYTARCHACKDTVKIRDLYRIHKSPLHTDAYFICVYCYDSYRIMGYTTDTAIYDNLYEHDKRNQPDKYKSEKDDKRRGSKVPISLEEVVELCWELEYQKEKIWPKLEESLKKDKEE